MTKKNSFFAFAPDTCMNIYLSAVQSDDEVMQAFAIRTLKTFLQEEQYMVEMALSAEKSEFNIADIIAAVVLRSPHLNTKVDACICLLQFCYLDSNALRSVVDLLPILNEWLRTGPVHAQHLAVELLANLATRFDLAPSIIAANCLPCLFDLCIAIDEATNNVAGLKENTDKAAGFIVGFTQPLKIEVLAHQLPSSIMSEFSNQFPNVQRMLEVMGSSQEFQTVGDLDARGRSRFGKAGAGLSKGFGGFQNGLSKGIDTLKGARTKDVSVGSGGSTQKPDGAEEEGTLSIGPDEFVAWLSTGSKLAEQIRQKIRTNSIAGISVDMQRYRRSMDTENPDDSASWSGSAGGFGGHGEPKMALRDLKATALEDDCTVWVGGLPDDLATETGGKPSVKLTALLEAECGPVLSATVRKKPRGAGGELRSWALVTFRSEDAAALSLDAGEAGTLVATIADGTTVPLQVKAPFTLLSLAVSSRLQLSLVH